MIENYLLSQTNRNPYIDFNAFTGELIMSGKFMTLEGSNSYKTAIEWIKEYIQEPAKSTQLSLYVDAINSGSAKALLLMLQYLKSINTGEKTVNIIWYFSDDEDLEDWKVYEDILGFTFDFRRIIPNNLSNLYYEPTTKSPTLDFNSKTGILCLKGDIRMWNAIEFFEPICAWIDEYIKDPQEITEYRIDKIRFNSAASKLLLDIFKKLEEIHGTSNKVIVKWYYYDDTDYYIGEDYGDLLKLDVKYIHGGGDYYD